MKHDEAAAITAALQKLRMHYWAQIQEEARHPVNLGPILTHHMLVCIREIDQRIGQ